MKKSICSPNYSDVFFCNILYTCLLDYPEAILMAKWAYSYPVCIRVRG